MTNKDKRNEKIEDLKGVAGGSKDWTGEARQIPLPGNGGGSNQQDAVVPGDNIDGVSEGVVAG